MKIQQIIVHLVFLFIISCSNSGENDNSKKIEFYTVILTGSPDGHKKIKVENPELFSDELLARKDSVKIPLTPILSGKIIEVLSMGSKNRIKAVLQNSTGRHPARNSDLVKIYDKYYIPLNLAAIGDTVILVVPEIQKKD